MSDRIDTDAVLHNAMIAHHLEDPLHQIDLEGDGWAATRQEQRDEVDFFSTLSDVASEARNHVLLDFALPKISHALGKTSLLIAAGVETIARAIETMEQGEGLNRGLQRDSAVDRRITTRAELATALRLNPDFAARYKHDLAFKLGTDSVVWAKAHEQLPALERQLPTPPMAATMEVRG